MESEMTTAEMVEYMRDEAGKIGLVADALRGGAPTSARVADSRSANYAAIADRLEALESLYAKAWAEIEYWRDNNGLIIDGKWHNGEYVGNGNYINHPVPNADAHDAARKEAGL